MGLRVEVDELHAAGTRMAHSVTTPVTLGAQPVAPAAGDQVSATVAAAVSARLQAIGAHSVRAGHITTTAAGVLHANAVTYRAQEDANAASLRPGGAAAGAVASSTAGLTAAVPTTGMPPVPASLPAGVVPTDGKAIAVLMHGGTGPGPRRAAANAARAHATELRQISTSLRSTGDRLAVDWQSRAGEAATARIATLASWYDDHAQHAAAAARACESQADSFGRARAAVPRPEQFEDLERRLQAAARANAAPGSFGRYTPVITALQTQLAATHAQAVTAYADYTTRAADVGGDSPTPAPPTVQALDNPTIKESPPGSPDTPDPGPLQPIHDGHDVQDLLTQFQRGSRGVRQVEWPQDVRRLYDVLVRNSVGEAPPTRTPYGDGGPTYGRVLDDGTVIRMRPTSGSGGPTVDVQYPWGGGEKVHIPKGSAPIVSELPAFPPAMHPPVALPPPQLGHPPMQVPPPAMFDPNGLPPWLQTSSPPGFALQPTQPPTIMPGQVLSSSPIDAAPATSAPGPSILDTIGRDLSSVGHGLADAGETAGKGILTGVVIIGSVVLGTASAVTQ